MKDDPNSFFLGGRGLRRGAGAPPHAIKMQNLVALSQTVRALLQGPKNLGDAEPRPLGMGHS